MFLISPGRPTPSRMARPLPAAFLLTNILSSMSHLWWPGPGDRTNTTTATIRRKLMHVVGTTYETHTQLQCVAMYFSKSTQEMHSWLQLFMFQLPSKVICTQLTKAYGGKTSYNQLLYWFCYIFVQDQFAQYRVSSNEPLPHHYWKYFYGTGDADATLRRHLTWVKFILPEKTCNCTLTQLEWALLTNWQNMLREYSGITFRFVWVVCSWIYSIHAVGRKGSGVTHVTCMLHVQSRRKHAQCNMHVGMYSTCIPHVTCLFRSVLHACYMHVTCM